MAASTCSADCRAGGSLPPGGATWYPPRMLTRRWSLLLVAGLAACGGGADGPDYASAFVGTWTGTASATSGGTTNSANNVALHITTSGTNALQIADICEDLSGPAATATSATSFTIGSRTCAPAPVTGCSSVTLAVASGTGTISGNTLTVAMSANLSGCSQSFPVTLGFTGTKTASGSGPAGAFFPALSLR